MEEKRRYIRWLIPKPVKYRIEEQVSEKQGLCYDISMMGIGLFLEEGLKPHTILKMVIEIPDEFKPLRPTGELIWQKDTIYLGKRGFMAGLSFIRMRDLDKEKLYNYILKNFREELVKRWWKDIS